MRRVSDWHPGGQEIIVGSAIIVRRVDDRLPGDHFEGGL